MRRASALLGAIAFTAVAAGAQDLGRNSETWTWEGRVESGRWFRLGSVNGPITIERSSDNMVHVHAVKDVGRGEVADVAFQVIQTGGDVRICALWRNDRCDEDGVNRRDRDDEDDDRARRRRDVKVRFTVRVPQGVRVSASTVNGEMRVSDATSEVLASTVNGRVEVRNVGGAVRASTVNGSVEVTTSNGPVRASTVNGGIDVRMTSLDREGDMKFNTVNGSITIETPSSLDARVRMSTLHGSISSDYPVQLSGRFGPRRAEGTVGRGGREIEMETVNGDIELKKSR